MLVKLCGKNKIKQCTRNSEYGSKLKALPRMLQKQFQKVQMHLETSKVIFPGKNLTLYEKVHKTYVD